MLPSSRMKVNWLKGKGRQVMVTFQEKKKQSSHLHPPSGWQSSDTHTHSLHSCDTLSKGKIFVRKKRTDGGKAMKASRVSGVRPGMKRGRSSEVV